jgi:hypothetical protein
MAIPAAIQKQIRAALYSSLAVSVLTTTPVFMMTRISFTLYPWTLLFATFLTIAMWGGNILLFYFTGSRRILRYAGSYAACLTLGLGMFHSFLHMQGFGNGIGAGGRGFYFHLILFFSVDTVLLIVQDLVVVRQRKAVVELENAQLRVQPHFLFNSLSTLKSLIRYSPRDAEEYVLKLSRFLRSAMESHASPLVTVAEELTLCVDYLEMQRIRFGEALQFTVAVPESMRTYYLPVFALQQLVENAIKHNILTKEHPLSIRVLGAGRIISVANNRQVRDAGETGKTGLANLRERYRALGGKDIVIAKSDTEFSVSISVFEHEHSDHRR